MKDLLKNNFEKAKIEYSNYLSEEIKKQVKRLENLIEKVEEDDVDEIFQDFNVRLYTDNSYSDYHNYIGFLTVMNGKVMVGHGVWDDDYDYDSFTCGSLPDEVSELEKALNEIIREIDCYEKNI